MGETLGSLFERRGQEQKTPLTPPRANSFSPSSSKSAPALVDVDRELNRAVSLPRHAREAGLGGERQVKPLQSCQASAKRAGPSLPSRLPNVEVGDERAPAARSGPTGRRASALGNVLSSRLFVRRTLSASRRRRA